MFQVKLRALLAPARASTLLSEYHTILIAATSSLLTWTIRFHQILTRVYWSPHLVFNMPLDPSPNAGPKTPYRSILKPATKQFLDPSSARDDDRNGSAPSTRVSGVSRPKSVVMDVPTTASRVASRLDAVRVDDRYRPNYSTSRADSRPDEAGGGDRWRPKDTTYNPSVGPTRSTMTTAWRNSNAPSRAGSTRSVRAPHITKYCRNSNYTRRDFRLGDVIAAPFHTSNTNPNVDPDDERLTLTCEGPAYSKRRMMIVLFIHIQDLYCLPLYSFSNRGLKEKPDHLKDEYVCMANDGEKGFVNQGNYPPVKVQARRPLTANTTVHLSGGLRVGCNEDITPVGRLTKQSYFELEELWQKIVDGARKEPWR